MQFYELPSRTQSSILVKSSGEPIAVEQLFSVFIPKGVLVMGIDDSIERRWGKCIAARGIYRQESAFK